MVQCGPEGIFRQVIKPKSKRLNKRGIGRPRGAMGAPPPKHLVDMGDHWALVEPVLGNPKEVALIDHVLVWDAMGKETHIRLFSGIRPDQIRQACRDAGLEKMKEARLHCSEDNWAEFTGLLCDLWPTAKFERGASTPAGVDCDMSVKIELVVNISYFQAIAKIGFHYFLTHSGRGFRGDEPHFEAIRRFITEGGNIEGFFKRANRPTFGMPFGALRDGRVITPDRWCHVLAACEADRQATAYVQLFVGPGCIPASYYIWLGQWSNPIISLNHTWGHVYLYDNPQQEGCYAGSVERAQITLLGTA